MEPRIELAWQRECVGGNCDAYYDAPGGKILQGKKVSAEAMAQLSKLGDDEAAIFLPDDVIDRIRRGL